jgi:hypothetical protein
MNFREVMGGIYISDLRHIFVNRSRYNSVGTETDYRLDDQGSIPGSGKNVFFFPQRQSRLRGPPSILYDAYRVLLPWGLSGRSLKFTTSLNLVPESIMVELYHHFPYVVLAF